MIQIENVDVCGWQAAIRGMRNPMNSWARSDSYYPDGTPIIGANDYDLMKRLASAGTEHGKYLRMIVVTADINAPLYWWKEFDTYKVGTVANSCSTMHRIHKKQFELSDFSTEHLCEESKNVLNIVVSALNQYRTAFVLDQDKKYWWQLVQLLPTSYNQKRTVCMNYQVLANMYKQRKNHKLNEWRDFCKWIETLPYSELITGAE